MLVEGLSRQAELSPAVSGKMSSSIQGKRLRERPRLGSVPRPQGYSQGF